MSKTSAVSVRTHIHSSFRDGIFTSLNIGLTESYFTAFMLALGISEIIAGLGVVTAQFIGVTFQLLSIGAFFRKFSLRKRLLLFLSIQAISLIPLMLIGTYSWNSPAAVILVLASYWACLLSLNPPWNKLMGHTIPLRFRLKFFSIRNQWSQISVLTGLLISGFFLTWARENQVLILGFVGLFGVGFCLKLLSWREIKNFHQDFQVNATTECPIRFQDFLKRLKGSEQGRLILFLFFFYFSVHFASPFFTPYMLKHLDFSYLEFMLVVATSYWGRILSFRFLRARARSHQVSRILIISTLGISMSPLLWAAHQNYQWILAIEFFSGCCWAGFELSTVLLYYQRVQDHERTSIMSYISFFNISGMALGTLSGAILMRSVPAGYDRYLCLFAVATFLRLAVVIFLPHVDMKGQLPKLTNMGRIFSVRAPFGVLSRPFMGKKSEEEKNKD